MGTSKMHVATAGALKSIHPLATKVVWNAAGFSEVMSVREVDVWNQDGVGSVRLMRGTRTGKGDPPANDGRLWLSIALEGAQRVEVELSQRAHATVGAAMGARRPPALAAVAACPKARKVLAKLGFVLAQNEKDLLAKANGQAGKKSAAKKATAKKGPGKSSGAKAPLKVATGRPRLAHPNRDR
jgi:hypothetical protein